MDFQDSFRRGLGRAVLFLQSHNAKPYREAILHGCSNFIGYDAQAEPSRAPYLFDIIQATGELEWYAPRIREMLTSGEEMDAPWQVFELAGLMAQDGDEQARQALYAAFTRDAARQDVSNGDVLIKLDGLDGYLFVVRQLLKNPLPEDDRWWEGVFLDKLEEKLGKEDARAGLERACAADPELAAHVARIRQEEEQNAANRAKRAPFVVPEYDELRALIVGGSKLAYPIRLARWGEHADSELMERLAHDTLEETDEMRLVKYLHLFRRRRFPLAPDRLLLLARDADKVISSPARRAVSKVTDPRVRELALSLVAQHDRPWEAVELLVGNYEDGDYARLEPLIVNTDDAEELHSLGYSVSDVFDAHSAPEAAAVLTMLYERNPCLLCRHRTVKRLLSLGPLPEWMVDECRYDADPETRRLVAS